MSESLKPVNRQTPARGDEAPKNADHLPTGAGSCPSRKLQLNVETSRHKPLALATQRGKGTPDLPQGPSACRFDLSPQVHPHEKLLDWLRQSLGQTCLTTCCLKHIRLATWSPFKGGVVIEPAWNHSKFETRPNPSQIPAKTCGASKPLRGSAQRDSRRSPR